MILFKDCVDRFQKWEGYFNISITDFKHMVEAYVNKLQLLQCLLIKVLFLMKYQI